MTDGLVSAFALDGEGRARPLERATERGEAGEWVWLHFERDLPETERWLTNGSHLSEPLVEALLEEETRPRHAPFDDGALVILRGVNLNTGAAAHEMISLRLFVSPTLVVSLRRHPIFAVQDIREACARGRGPGSAGQLLADIVEGMTDRIAREVEGMEDALDDLEERAIGAEPERVRADILSLRRRALPMKRFLAPQREALHALARAPFDFLDEGARTLIAEEADRTVRLVEALDALRERAGLLQEEVTGIVADRMNRNTYTLSIVAAIFLPLGFLTGLLGINVGGMPGTENPYAFWMTVAACVALAVVSAWAVRWL